MNKHAYGYLHDTYDDRDYAYRLAQKEISLPPSVDLRKFCSSIQDQGELGACTGFAIADGLREFMMNYNGVSHVDMSPLFLYYQERVIEGTVNEDAGASIRDGMKVLCKIGCATEVEVPYIPSKFNKRPSCITKWNARKYRTSSYYRLDNEQNMKICLTRGNGIVIGIDIYESFESTGSNGIVPIPEKNEQILGGHALFLCGYKVIGNHEYWILKNSWSRDWGEKGYCYLPFGYEGIYDVWTASL